MIYEIDKASSNSSLPSIKFSKAHTRSGILMQQLKLIDSLMKPPIKNVLEPEVNDNDDEKLGFSFTLHLMNFGMKHIFICFVTR